MKEKSIAETLNEIESLEQALEMVNTYSTERRFLTVHDEQGKFVSVPEGYLKATEYRWEDIQGETPYSFFHPDDMKEILKSHATITIGTEHYVVEYRNRAAAGNYLMFRTHSRQLQRDGDKNCLLAITEYLGS